MYLTFAARYQEELDHVKQQIEKWADQYNIRYSQKTIKWRHRLAFDRPEDFTLFYMTWSGPAYEIVDLGNERY